MCKIITITEAARQLGVTTQTLRNWHKNGIIEIKRIGNASYINKDFIDSLTETAVRIEETLKRLRVLEEENRILKTQIATLTQEEKTGVDEKMKELLCMKIETCNLSTRAINILRVNDIRTIGALCVTHPRYFRNRRNLGKKTKRELTDFLEGLGLSWNTDINKYF